MTLIGSLNPYSHTAPLVDKLIGDAYDVVKEVYDNMEYVVAVGASIRASNVGEPLMLQRIVETTGATGAAGATVVITFDDLDLDYTKIIDSYVTILGSDGVLYLANSNMFSHTISAAGMSLTLVGGAPAAIQNATLKWYIIYGG